MDSPKESQQVFHPSSIPVDRASKTREGRKRTCQFCFYTAVALLALFGAGIIVGGGYLIARLSRGFLFPTKSFAIDRKHIQPYNASQVHPLIGPNSVFDIHATVWQDVTDLLARGDKLPDRDEPWQIVEEVMYTRSSSGASSNFTRSDAVVWTGKIAKGATVDSKIHTSVPLRIPMAPLYTNGLGRSSLRATFSISIPEKQAQAYGTFRNVSYMLPSELPILPKRMDFAEKKSEYSLDHALADAGISTSLLELVPSPFYRTDSQGIAAPRTIDNRTKVSPFFDRHLRNLHFLEANSSLLNQSANGQLPEFRDGEGRILIPHLRTRSRIGLVKSRDVFDNSTFRQMQIVGGIDILRACTSWNNVVCERPYWKHAFESMLTFAKQQESSSLASDIIATTDDDKDVQEFHYYGPVLTQVSIPGSPQFQRRIPHRMPKLGREPAILRGNASVACKIPDARLDTSGQYFEIEWNLYFSSHMLQRVLVAESDYTSWIRPLPAPLGPGEESEKEIIASSMRDPGFAETTERFLTGDRIHEKDHPTRFVMTSFAVAIWHLVVDEIFLIWFWYSRKTSAGLWIEAQWAWVVLAAFKYVVDAARPFIADEETSWWGWIITIVWGSTGLIHVPLVIMTLLHVQRPANLTKWWQNPLGFRRRRATRREIKSIELGNSIGKRPFYMLFAGLLVFYLLIDHSIFVLNPADRCIVDDTGGTAAFSLKRRIYEETTRSLPAALLNTQKLAQAYFNYRSETFTGSFRIAAIGTAVLATSLSMIMLIDSFASWRDAKYTQAITVDALLELAVVLLFGYQAVMYKGVPQKEREDEDEDE